MSVGMENIDFIPHSKELEDKGITKNRKSSVKTGGHSSEKGMLN
jgi:hypothetical protein